MTRSIARPTTQDVEFKAYPTGDTLALTQVIGTPHESTIVDEKGETIPVGIAEHIVAVTGVVDEVGDVIVPGAFRRTMREIKAKGVTGHDWKVRVSKALDRQEWLPGDPRIAEKIIPNLPEGKVWPAEAGALYVKAQYNLATKEGRDAYENAKFYGNEENYSIGYKVTPGGAVRKNGIRYIKDLDWYEWSDVLHGANKWAQLLSVKSLDTLNGQFERTGLKALAAPADTTAPEVGAIELKVRYVRNTAYWGLPYGAPIPTGFSPRGALAQRLRSEGRPVREDVGVVEVEPSKKDATLRVKPTAKGKFKRNDTLFEQQIMDEFERVQSGDADPFAQTTTDKDGDPVDGFLVDDTEQINKGGVYDPMAALIANGRTPAEVEEVLRGSDVGQFTYGRMGEEDEQRPQVDAYIADVMIAYRQKYNAALTKQNDDGKDDVAPIVDGAPDAGAPTAPAAPAAPTNDTAPVANADSLTPEAMSDIAYDALNPARKGTSDPQDLVNVLATLGEDRAEELAQDLTDDPDWRKAHKQVEDLIERRKTVDARSDIDQPSLNRRRKKEREAAASAPSTPDAAAAPDKPADLSPLASRMFDAIAATKPSPYLGNRLAEAADTVGGNAGITLRGTATNLAASAKLKKPKPRISPERGAERTLKNYPDKLADNVESYAALADALDALGLGDQDDRGDGNGTIGDYMRANSKAAADLLAAQGADGPRINPADEWARNQDREAPAPDRTGAVNAAYAAFTYGPMEQVEIDEPELLDAFTRGGVHDPEGAVALLVAERDNGSKSHDRRIADLFSTDAELNEEIATAEKELERLDVDPSTLSTYDRKNHTLLMGVAKSRIGGAKVEQRRRAGENVMPKPKPAPEPPQAPAAPPEAVRLGVFADADAVLKALDRINGTSRDVRAADAARATAQRIRDGAPVELSTVPGVFAVGPTKGRGGNKTWTVHNATGAQLPYAPLRAFTGEKALPKTPKRVRAFLDAMAGVVDADGNPAPWDSTDNRWIGEWRDKNGAPVGKAYSGVVLPAYLRAIGDTANADEIEQRYREFLAKEREAGRLAAPDVSEPRRAVQAPPMPNAPTADAVIPEGGDAASARQRSLMRREAVKNGDDAMLARLDAARDKGIQSVNDADFRADPDAYRRSTATDAADGRNSGHKTTGDPATAGDLTWMQLQAEIEQANRDGKPDVAAAFQAERDRRDKENADRRAALGMPAATPGPRGVETVDTESFDAELAARAPVATGNMNAPEDMSPEQLDAEIAAARKLQADLRARKVPANSAQLADAKMRQKVFETEKRKREQGSTTPTPSTQDVPEAVVEPSTPDAVTAPEVAADTTPDALTLPDGRELTRDELDEQESEFLTDRWTLRGDDGRVRATVERDVDGDYTWTVMDGDRSRSGYGARGPEDATDRLAQQLDATPDEGQPDTGPTFAPDETEPPEEFTPGEGETIPADDLAQARDLSGDAEGLIEADDGELEVSPDVAERQDRVEALLAQAPDLSGMDDATIGETRRDVVDELRLQEEIARRDRARGTAPATTDEPVARTVGEPDASGVEGDGGESSEVEPTGPKPRPGVAGAAEDLADALDDGDTARIATARTRLDSSLRRSRSDSPVVGELRTLLAADGDPDAAAIRDAADRLRTEARDKRNAGARSRRLAKRLERERLRALLGQIDAEMRTRNLDPDRFGGPAPVGAPGGDAPAVDTTPDAVPGGTPDAPDDVITPDELAQARDLAVAEDAVREQAPEGAPPAPAEPAAPAPAGRTPATYGELQPGDTFVSPESGDTITVDNVQPQRNGRVAISGSDGNEGREFNLLGAADPIPGATPEAGPQGPVTPATGTPGAPPAPAPAAVTPDPPDSPAARMMTARIGDRLTARTGGSTAAELVFETTGEPVKQRDGDGRTVTSVDARSNTLGEGSLRSFVDWTDAPRLTFTPDSDGREITLSPTSLDNGNPLDAVAVPEGTYRAADNGQQTVVGQHYVGGYKQISPRRWAWSAELYPADGAGGAVVSKNGKAADAEEAQRAIRDAVETGYLTRSDYGSRVPEGETLPAVPERSVAPVARSVVGPVDTDLTDLYSGPVNPITGRPDYTEAPETLATAIPTRFAGAGIDEISAHFAERIAGGTRALDPATIQWDTVIVAPGGGLMAYRETGPYAGRSGYAIASTVSGATLTFGSVNVDRSTAVAIMDTLTRGVTPGGGQIDWDKDSVGARTLDEDGLTIATRSPLATELDRAFPDEGGSRGLAKFGLSRVIATKLERNQANSPVVRNAVGVFYAGKVDPKEYPNHESADREITTALGAVESMLHDGKRNRASWATDDRTDEQIKDDAETIRYARGAQAVFNLGAPDKAIALIERRIDELEQIYGHSGTDATQGGAGARGSINLRAAVAAMRAAFDPQAKGPQALKAMQRGDRFITRSPGSPSGRRVFRVQSNTEAPGVRGARMLHVLEEGATHVGANRVQRIEVTDRGFSFAEGITANRPISRDAVRLDADEVAPEGAEAVADRLAQTTPMPALDEAITRAREVLDNRIGPITREKPKAASRKADRADRGDADRSAVVNRPGAGSANAIDPEVGARILDRQSVLMRARLGQDVALVEEPPRSPAFAKVSDVKGTWGENELSEDVEFWRTARLSQGGWFVTGKDGTIRHAETGALMTRGLADQSTADRFASYLERAVDPETGQAYDWREPQSTVRGMHRTATARIAADPENPTRAEQMRISDQMPVRALKDMAELDELVAKGPGATKKLIAPVAGQHDKGDLPGGFHVPGLDQDVYVQATGTVPGQRGDYPDKASTDNAKKLMAAYDWARTVGAVRPFDAIDGLRGAAEKNRGEKIVRNVRGNPDSRRFDASPVVGRGEADLGDVLDKLADSLERDADPDQWSEMDKLNRAGGQGDLSVSNPKVQAQELASGRGAAENAAYAKAIADAIKVNGVRLEYNPNATYRGVTRIPPHWQLRVPGARGFGEQYSDPGTGDLVIEQLDQYDKGVTVTPDGTVHAQWRTPAPNGPDYAETIMHITFEDGDWKFVEQAVDADGHPIGK